MRLGSKRNSSSEGGSSAKTSNAAPAILFSISAVLRSFWPCGYEWSGSIGGSTTVEREAQAILC